MYTRSSVSALLEWGQCVPQDTEEAAKWYAKAVKLKGIARPPTGAMQTPSTNSPACTLLAGASPRTKRKR
jgi:TPR repeat protein